MATLATWADGLVHVAHTGLPFGLSSRKGQGLRATRGTPESWRPSPKRLEHAVATAGSKMAAPRLGPPPRGAAEAPKGERDGGQRPSGGNGRGLHRALARTTPE